MQPPSSNNSVAVAVNVGTYFNSNQRIAGTVYHFKNYYISKSATRMAACFYFHVLIKHSNMVEANCVLNASKNIRIL